MGINFEEVKAIIQLGIMGVISHTYITQQKRLFEQQEKVITVLAKLENQLNNDFLKGKGLEIALILKIQDMRWAVQKRILKYIKNNHLEENWDVINKEIKTFFDAKMINFENDMHDIIEETTYKLLSKMIKDEFEQTKEILLHILDDLKREGVEEKDLYGKAARIVETHMESIENELVAKIKSLINLYKIRYSDVLMTANTRLYDDTIPVLTHLKKNGALCCIVSTKTRSRISETLQRDGIESLIDCIIGFEDVTEPKPSGEGIHLILHCFNLAHSDVLYIGDSLIDMDTAQAAGVNFAAVTTGMTTVADFTAAGQYRILQNLSELI